MKLLQLVDPVCCCWNVPLCSSCNVWCDASSLTIGVVLYVDGVCVKDQSWLRLGDDDRHINVAELESILNGISLVVSWKIKCFIVMTDSSCVFKIKARGLSEVLVRR